MTKFRNPKKPPKVLAEPVEDPPPRTTPVRVGPLHTLEAIRVEMAKVYREARQGRMRSDDASRMSYMLQQLVRVIEAQRDTEYIERIIALEQRLNLKGSSNVFRLESPPRAAGGGGGND